MWTLGFERGRLWRISGSEGGWGSESPSLREEVLQTSCGGSAKLSGPEFPAEPLLGTHCWCEPEVEGGGTDLGRPLARLKPCTIFFFLLQGKFIRINFDVAGYIVGANIETCIL